MPQRWLWGAWPAVKSLNPHSLHQCFYVLTANFYSLSVQHVTQHPAARKRMVEVQSVDPAHHRQILRNPLIFLFAAIDPAPALSYKGEG